MWNRKESIQKNQTINNRYKNIIFIIKDPISGIKSSQERINNLKDQIDWVLPERRKVKEIENIREKLCNIHVRSRKANI